MFVRFETRYTINVPEQFDVFIQKSIRWYVRYVFLFLSDARPVGS